MNHDISFEPLQEAHLSWIHDWFNAPHIQAFYSLRAWSLEEVRKKLTPYIQDLEDIQGYIIFMNKKPTGYIQRYPVKKYPWDHCDLSDAVIQHAAGIDLFIGEKECLGKGIGYQVVEAFLHIYIWPYYRYCLADPDLRNEASLRLFKKCGFQEYQQIQTKNALHYPVTLQLFIKERDA